MSVCIDYPCADEYLYQSSLAEKINKRLASSDKFFSLEFYPPRTRNGTCNLLEKCERLVEGSPLFCDVTCDLKNGSCDDETMESNSLRLATATQELCGVETMLQMNCANLTEYNASEVLMQAKSVGLRNVLAMKEAPSSLEEEMHHSSSSVDFRNTVDLVRFIKRNFGNYFTICVAGYPSTIESENGNFEESIDHLLEEVREGANFVITQMVFEADMLVTFIKKCRKLAIDVPIIPGILPIQSFACIKQLSKLSSIKIPQKVMNVLQPIKENDEAVLKYGTYLTVQLCSALLETALVCGLHFYTLNREIATKDILKCVGLWKAEIQRRVLPWQQCSENQERAMEETVRPIFWSLRPESYVYRTSQWEEFPNGRWGDSSCSSFGRFRDYHLFFSKNRDRLPELKQMWGEQLQSAEDVIDVFAAFISGEPNKQGIKVTNIPWTEDDLAPETTVIRERLTYLNKNGILTINSQPHVNCVASCDKVFGWGSPGGYVFQKGYLEFFANKEDALNLLTVLEENPYVNYHIVNRSGSENFTNTNILSPNAVTWGVFTGRPVLQPTVVDPQAFQFWKDEAFELWIQQWGRLYPVGSKSREIIQNFHDNYCLVNLVDNDFIKGNCLFDVVDKVISMRRK